MSSRQSASPWRGYTNQIVYGTELQSPIDDDLLNRLADELIRQRYFRDPVESYYKAAVDALKSGEDIRLDDSQDEGAVHDLLTRLLVVLDERRPWPEPAFKALPVEEWRAIAAAPKIGQIPARPVDVQGRLYRSFAHYEWGGQELRILILRLRSGQIVGLRIGSLAQPNVDVYSPSDPVEVRASLQDLGLDLQTTVD
ncbi:hypothetical protein PT015_23930 [Candidatus Mycobacterium wuenschmannii]|uniref:Uncharacterized protein n=1 Tax=Candidatus Mycobacterium wuenschmannii TaxID=3027808 RepID=A0ABY8VXV0_9MYCO|nr:hypothetical protein [Candidatus Mycobacterium wuenschmannii]WIM87835.1 hypothetical protein PT015_23930 [Candidatus Mycobacterium wuenschmannii]